jgi:D-glycero-alpha-D-manno-heptose-7-phosphate kinase
MIISRTPFRISFFGGGTDYPAWYKENGGAVLSTTIDKYCYITLRYLPPFFAHKYRIAYSKIETVKRAQDIQHPSVRALIKYMGVTKGLEIHHDGDLPARSGLGSSSSFTVGLLHALHALKGRIISKETLAREAIHIERDLLKENVGSQDQVAVACGGFNRIEFGRGGEVRVDPVSLCPRRLQELEKRLMLFYTGLQRFSSEVAAEQVRTTSIKKQELTAIHHMVDRAVDVLNGVGTLKEFGRLLHESWLIKRNLTSRITNERIDEIYRAAKKAGALGGKLLGAGGGGFMLFLVEPEHQALVRRSLKDLLWVRFAFERDGSRIIHYDV